MKVIDGDKLQNHLDYLIQKEKQLAKECSLYPNNEFERQRRYCFEANALAYGLCMNIMNYYIATDIQTVKHGRWIEHHDLIECNVCGFEVKDTYCEKRDMTSSETSYDYCPKCGARMREPEMQEC